MDKLEAKVMLISRLFNNQQVKELADHYRTTVADVISQLKTRIVIKQTNGRYVSSIDFTDSRSLINVKEKLC